MGQRVERQGMKNLKLLENILFVMAAVSVIAAICIGYAAFFDGGMNALDGVWVANIQSSAAYASVSNILMQNKDDGLAPYILMIDFAGKSFIVTRYVIVSGWNEAPHGEPSLDSDMIDPFLLIAGVRSSVLFYTDIIHYLGLYESWTPTGNEAGSSEESFRRVHCVVSRGTYEILEQGDLIKFIFADGSVGVSSLVYDGNEINLDGINTLKRAAAE